MVTINRTDNMLTIRDVARLLYLYPYIKVLADEKQTYHRRYKQASWNET